MSNIPYPFIPIPRIFFKNGFLDPKKKNFEKRLSFIVMTFSKCYAVPRLIDGISYDSFEFSCSYEELAVQLNGTCKEIRCLFDLFIDSGFMIKTPNKIANRENFFKWDTSKFISEKVTVLNDVLEQSKEKRADQNSEEKIVHNSKKGQTIYREENSKKGQTKNESNFDSKNEEKGRPNEKRADQRADQRADHLRVENEENGQKKGRPKGTFLKNDKEAIELSLSNSDNLAKPRACEELSLSCKSKITAVFNPRAYKLRDGHHLSFRMQNALVKYSPEEWKKVVANVQFYEEYCDSGKPIRMGHERFLQHCINKNLANKRECALKNDIWAKYTKSEYNLTGMQILRTTVILKKPNGEQVSIDKELPHQTFTHILDNYINFYQESRHAT